MFWVLSILILLAYGCLMPFNYMAVGFFTKNFNFIINDKWKFKILKNDNINLNMNLKNIFSEVKKYIKEKNDKKRQPDF